MVSDVTFSQGPNGATGTKVDIYYTLAFAGGNCAISANFSKDSGATFPFAVASASGDIGANVTPGTGKHIVWDVAADFPNEAIPQAAIQVVASGAGTGGPYNVGYTTVTYQDPARGNRNVPAKIYYPGTSAGQNVPVAGGSGVRFPVVVFGHGFVIGIDFYPYLWQNLAPTGYILVYCNTETGLLPNHGRYGQDLAFLVNQLQTEGASPASRFYSKVAPASAVMGHSMGGGASFLSVQHSANIKTIVTFAAAETNPSAIAAAGSITIPALVIAGSQDCVAPPDSHQIPMYEALLSSCKYYESIVDGSHCQFAVNSTLCELAEGIPCLGRSFVNEDVQRALVIEAVLPWLDVKLKGLESGRAQFLQQLADGAAAGDITYEGGCTFTNRDESSTGPIETVRPTVSSVVPQTPNTIQVAFSEAMLAPGVTTSANYVLSDAGAGNLAGNPSSVTGAGPYVLAWVSGEMLDAHLITVTVAGVQDLVGNVLALPNSGSGTGIGTIPTGAINIEDAATPGYTNSVTVDLICNASDPVGVASMRFSNDGVVWTPSDWASAPPFATSFTGWELTGGDGPKTVFAQFRDNAGNVSTATISDAITLDQTPPTATLASTAPDPTNDAVPVDVWLSEPSPHFGPGSIAVTNATVVGFDGSGVSYSFILSPLDQGAVSCVVSPGVFTDAAGNSNGAPSNPMVRLYDGLPPTGSVSINGGSPYCTSTAILLGLIANDAGSGVVEAQFSNDGASWSGWEPFEGIGAWTLDPGDGVKTAFVQFRDGAGNVSTDAISDSVVLDTAAPTGTLSINEGAVLTTSPAVTLALSADDAGGSGVDAMQFSNDGSAWSTWEPLGDTKAWHLTSGDGLKMVYVQYWDIAGNVSSLPINAAITLDGTPPTAVISVMSNNPTGSDSVDFAVTFSESVAPTFDANDVSVTGTLSGNVQVTGTDPNYLVTVTLDQPDADGQVGVAIGTNVSDVAGNPFPAGVSPACGVFNWRGFSRNPANVQAYTGDSTTFEVVADCGATSLVYQWKWDEGIGRLPVNGPATATWALSGLTPSACGEYWCEVYYDGATYPSGHGVLTVRDHLYVAPLEDQTLQQGESLTLTMLANGGYDPLSYAWTKDGNAIPDATGGLVSIPFVRIDDAGTYRVEVADANTDVQTVSMELTVTASVPVAGIIAAAGAWISIVLLGAYGLRKRRGS